MFRVVFRVLGALKPHRMSYKGVCETHNKGGLGEGGEEGFTGEHGVGKPSWMCGSSTAVLSKVRPNVQVLQNFISEEEEADFLQELDPGLKRKRYEFDHWDDVRNHFYPVSDCLDFCQSC